MYFLDCEASSLNDRSFPIEIAWVADTGAAESYLIRPETHWTDWSAKSESLHKISYAMLHRDGKSAASVAARAVQVLSNHVIVSDNPSWDQNWLAVLLATIRHPPLPVSGFDRVLAAQMHRLLVLNSQAPNTAGWHREARHLMDYGQSLVGVAQYNSIVSATIKHRAMADAERLWRCWCEVKTKIDHQLK